MVALAGFYRTGEGVAQDVSKALEWLNKAVKAGDADAMGVLGEIFAEGALVPRDLRLAREWYTKAIAAGRQDLAEALQELK